MADLKITEDELKTIEADLIRLGPCPALNLVRGKLTAIAYTDHMAKASWDRGCSVVGLTPADFGRTVQVKRDHFRIVGLNLRSTRFPVEAVRVSDGKQYRIPASAVK